MASSRIRKIAVPGAILAVAVLIAGCPFPLPPGYTESSRENLSAETTERLVPGVTTREEVLLLLGEPDGVGPNDTWLAYGSVYGEGGSVFVICAGNSCGGAGAEKMKYGRLVVSFDESGLMTNAEFVSRKCWEGIFAIDSHAGRSQPCMQVNAPDSDEQMAAPSADLDASYQGSEASIPKDLLDFAKGNAELITPGWTTGFAAAWAAGNNTPLTKDLHDRGQWEALARVVLNDNYGDNLRWYYLGRAAEGMGLCDTALRYYRICEERSKSFATRCLGRACAGIKLPKALEGRLIAIEAKRKAGRCYVPPAINP